MALPSQQVIVVAVCIRSQPILFPDKLLSESLQQKNWNNASTNWASLVVEVILGIAGDLTDEMKTGGFYTTPVEQQFYHILF